MCYRILLAGLTCFQTDVELPCRYPRALLECGGGGYRLDWFVCSQDPRYPPRVFYGTFFIYYIVLF
jgi:hypothetical protein